MSGSEAKSGSSTPSGKGRQASMLLRISHRDGEMEEYYLANGLSIGRSEANTIQLLDDAVGRSHARVVFQTDGTASMVCVDAETFMSVGETRVRELKLVNGMRFDLGKTSFECVDGLRQPFKEPVSNLNKCPYCTSTNIDTNSDSQADCKDCKKRLLVLTNIPGFQFVVVPAEFGDFSVVSFAARGGMGLVLEGKSKKDGARVAIKLLLPNKSVSSGAAERFRQEVSMMRRVRHPRVVSLLNYGREGRSNYLVMEWADGNTLRDVVSDSVKAGKPITFERASKLFEQMCKGIAAIHAAGIVHRDLKPSNVLIDADGNARISDLGIAKGTEASQTQLTQTGEVVGSSDYMAPEQFTAPELADQRADLYSLGVMTYELLTNSRPVGAWISPSQINPTVSTEFDEVVAKLLQRKPDNRYSDVHDLQVAIGISKQYTVPAIKIPISRNPTTDSLPAKLGDDDFPNASELQGAIDYLSESRQDISKSQTISPEDRNKKKSSLTGGIRQPSPNPSKVSRAEEPTADFVSSRVHDDDFRTGSWQGSLEDPTPSPPPSVPSEPLETKQTDECNHPVQSPQLIPKSQNVIPKNCKQINAKDVYPAVNFAINRSNDIRTAKVKLSQKGDSPWKTIGSAIVLLIVIGPGAYFRYAKESGERERTRQREESGRYHKHLSLSDEELRRTARLAIQDVSDSSPESMRYSQEKDQQRLDAAAASKELERRQRWKTMHPEDKKDDNRESAKSQ